MCWPLPSRISRDVFTSWFHLSLSLTPPADRSVAHQLHTSYVFSPSQPFFMCCSTRSAGGQRRAKTCRASRLPPRRRLMAEWQWTRSSRWRTRRPPVDAGNGFDGLCAWVEVIPDAYDLPLREWKDQMGLVFAWTELEVSSGLCLCIGLIGRCDWQSMSVLVIVIDGHHLSCPEICIQSDL